MAFHIFTKNKSTQESLAERLDALSQAIVAAHSVGETGKAVRAKREMRAGVKDCVLVVHPQPQTSAERRK